ncbi:hypothetical protein AAFC00_002034 [Neodothiora populina]|uniref:Uncharacterized protein n=1 Tax=Neodothiora populina TaxID=2781224 RepID=A0ABR3PGH7_9PEZI
MEENTQPQGRIRPESVIARNFSEDLDSLFGLNSGTTIGHLNHTVQEKKRNVSTQEEELAALEERIREAEERLARASGAAPAEQRTSSTSSPSESQHENQQAQTMSGAEQNIASHAAYAPAGHRPSNPRADSSFHPHIPGAMPRTPTPRYEAREYVTVNRTR